MSNFDTTRLLKTRAEEYGVDVWNDFFIPPYFDQLKLKQATKSTYIIGKRGCGKTMLLKYLDFRTAFSPKRDNIPLEEVSHIGIYWRVDTQFCSSLQLRGIDEDEWQSIFDGYFSLVISIEILNALRQISHSSYEGFTPCDLENLELVAIKDFSKDFPVTVLELEKKLLQLRRAFSMWVSNIGFSEKPQLPAGQEFLLALIECIKLNPNLSDSAFYIYIDEVENLVPYQKRVLNSFLKHSKKPLIINFASKEQSDENSTTGPESVNGSHDYRLINLDDYLSDEDRNLFFAEVFLANMAISQKEVNSELLKHVQTPSLLAQRKTDAYKKNIYSDIKQKFPSLSEKDLAKQAFNDDTLKKILVRRISQALERKKTSLTADDFFKVGFAPDAFIILPALLNRNLPPEDILISLEEYVKTNSGRFETGWIHNNLMGALLELYRPYGRVCPVYSGFDTLCVISNNNLRNFLILCYKSLEAADLNDEELDMISLNTQASACYSAAEQLIKEIRTFGPYGEQLRTFVLRLGSLFRATQSSLAMSEPEQNQFTINSGSTLDSKALLFLNEAKKYAVLVERFETKTKNSIGSDIYDFQLNPIYAAYFQISYRRKRKISISTSDFEVLYSGLEDHYQNLIKRFSKDLTNQSLSLDL